MSDEGFSSAWDAIDDTPAEAENLKLRSALMIALEEHRASWPWRPACMSNCASPRRRERMG
jgi:hypothetical protein